MLVYYFELETSMKLLEKMLLRASKILGITLTKRGAGSDSETALAGFPHHSLNTYLPKLVKAGLRVAICDQLEDPKMTKTIVKTRCNRVSYTRRFDE